MSTRKKGWYRERGKWIRKRKEFWLGMVDGMKEGKQGGWGSRLSKEENERERGREGRQKLDE